MPQPRAQSGRMMSVTRNMTAASIQRARVEISMGEGRFGYSHFFHLKNAIGSTATTTIRNSAHG